MLLPEPTVYIVDDDDAVRDSLVWLLSSVKMPVKAFASAEEFLEALDPTPTGCVLIDVRMPGTSGLQLQEILKDRAANLSVIIVTGHADVPMAIRAMKAGAVDFVEKPFNDQQVLELVSKAMEKNTRAVREIAQGNEIRGRYHTLTPRETEVFRGLIAGLPNKAIAADLGLSQKTVEIHRAKVMR
ncbi:MAG: response regulator transcription factor, partial [Rhodospirillales bacterium]|nr:response regulator transcription factor [Rhodospirillales bacterium]